MSLPWGYLPRVVASAAMRTSRLSPGTPTYQHAVWIRSRFLLVCRGLTTKSSENNDTDRDVQTVATATDWVPPSHDLAGDKGQSYLYTHIENVSRELHQGDVGNEPDSALSSVNNKTQTVDVDDTSLTVDWLKTRRAVLSDSVAMVQPSATTATTTTTTTTGQLMKPHDAQRVRQAAVDDIAVKEHMLFTRQEIVQILLAMGGQDIQVVLDTVGMRTSGSGNSGPTGNVLATGTGHAHLKTLAETLIRQLRRRKLHDVGVVGAAMGADGNWNDPHERWFVVDCHNYVVHLQDTKTRRAVNLEGLWSGQDGLYKLNMDDDNAVEDYVAANPVPVDYHGGMAAAASLQGGATGDWDDTLKQLAKSRWTTATPSSRRPIAAPKRPRKTSGRKT